MTQMVDLFKSYQLKCSQFNTTMMSGGTCSIHTMTYANDGWKIYQNNVGSLIKAFGITAELFYTLQPSVHKYGYFMLQTVQKSCIILHLQLIITNFEMIETV